MGWGSGSELAEGLWDDLRPLIPKKHRKKAALAVIEAVENHDCDTIQECEQLCKDAEVTFDDCGRREDDE